MNAVAQVVAKAEMLIRRPIAEVFEAFVDPAITARFWFSRGAPSVSATRISAMPLMLGSLTGCSRLTTRTSTPW